MEDQSAAWLAKAQAAIPALHRKLVKPVSLISIRPDDKAFQGFVADVQSPAGEIFGRELSPGDSFVLDFGRHIVGRLSLSIKQAGPINDAPLRLALMLGETLSEVAEPLEPFNSWLCRSWLQDEVLNIDDLPARVELPRRYAFRYVKVTVVATPQPVTFTDIACRAVTSASWARLPAPPAADTPLLRKMFEVGVHTLRNCTQTVFEDGPKRDRRLWMGDLRLQALANYHTFKDYALVRRCLYLLAGLPCDNGMVPSCVFEHPQPVTANMKMLDYAALYIPTLLEYGRYSGDWQTPGELFPVVLRQAELILERFDEHGLYRGPGSYIEFIDWKQGLDRNAAMQAICIYSLKQAVELAGKLGRADDLRHVPERIDKMVGAARNSMIDGPSGLAVSGPQRQVSFASNVWMIFAGVLSPDEGRRAMEKLFDDPNAIRPVTPYLWQYATEAMFLCGMSERARAFMIDYWGGMVQRGATTYWEVYDPGNDKLSPYGDYHVNSYCHAWSCGPAYLIPRYLA